MSLDITIIGYMKLNKTVKNIIITDSKEQFQKSGLNPKGKLVTSVNISTILYYAKFYNPPFFDKIICLNDNLTEEDLKKYGI